MPVRGDDSLMFATGVDTSGLATGAKSAGGIIQNLANTISKINPFAALGVAAIGAFALISKAAFDLAKEYEVAMTEVATISQAARDDFAKVGSEIFALSKINPETPVKLAKAFYQIVSAGYDGAEGMKVLEVAANAALAGVTSTETAADGITTVLNAFKVAAEDADAVADAMFKTVELGKTNFEQLSSNMSTAAPLAAALGVSYNEVLAAVASLTKQGVPTAQAMTQIRAAMIAANDELGDGWANAYTLQDAFVELADRADGSTAALKEMVGRIEGVSAILALTGDNAQGAAKDLKDLADSYGSVNRAADIQLSGNQRQWDIFSNNIKAATENLGNFWLSYSTNFAKTLNSFFDDTNKVNDAVSEESRNLTILQQELRETNTTQERRKEIFDILKAAYPNLLGNLDAETTTTEELGLALQNVNDQLLLKIAYQQKGDLIGEAASKVVEKNRLILQGENELRIKNLETIALAEKNQVKLNYAAFENLKPLQAAKVLQEQILGTSAELRDIDTGELTLPNSTALQAQIKLLEDLEYWANNLANAQTDQNKIVLDLQLATGDPRQVLSKGIEEQLAAITKTTKLEILEILKGSDYEDVVAKVGEELDRRRKAGRPSTVEEEAKAVKILVDSLKLKEREYARYEAAIVSLGKEAADEMFATLIQSNDSYGSYLADRYILTTNALEKEVLAVAAGQADIQIIRNDPKALINKEYGFGYDETGKPQVVSIIVKTDSTELDKLEFELKQLENELADPARWRTTEVINAEKKAAQAKIDIITGGVKQENSLYQWLENNSDIRRREAIKKYITFWRNKIVVNTDGNKEIAKANANAEDNVTAGIDLLRDKTSGTIGDISTAIGQAGNIFRKFGEDDIAGLLDQLAGVGQGIAQIAKGDPMSVIMGSLQVLESALTVEIKSDTAEFEKNIKGLERAITRLNNVLGEAYGLDKIRERERLIIMEQEQMQAYKDAIDAENEARKQVKFLGITVGDKGTGSGTDPAKIEELADGAEAARIKLLELRQAIDELYTGTTAETITSSILQGFEEGKKGAEDFAGTFEDLMRKAILESLRLSFLDDAVKKFYDQFALLSGTGDGLDESEIALLETTFNQLIKDGTERMDALNEILGAAGISAQSDVDRQGLSGGIQTITEDTANVLAGTLNKIMVDTAVSTEAALESMFYLSSIDLRIGSMVGLMETNNLRLQNIEKALS